MNALRRAGALTVFLVVKIDGALVGPSMPHGSVAFHPAFEAIG